MQTFFLIVCVLKRKKGKKGVENKKDGKPVAWFILFERNPSFFI
jgi:hypothetical protein